jgi:hypothetical protein
VEEKAVLSKVSSSPTTRVMADTLITKYRLAGEKHNTFI